MPWLQAPTLVSTVGTCDGKNGLFQALNCEPSRAQLAICRASILLCFAWGALYRGHGLRGLRRGLDEGIRTPTERNNVTNCQNMATG